MPGLVWPPLRRKRKKPKPMRSEWKVHRKKMQMTLERWALTAPFRGLFFRAGFIGDARGPCGPPSACGRCTCDPWLTQMVHRHCSSVCGCTVFSVTAAFAAVDSQSASKLASWLGRIRSVELGSSCSLLISRWLDITIGWSLISRLNKRAAQTGFFIWLTRRM